MAARLLALRGLWANGGLVPAGDELTTDDATAADLLSSGKAAPADEPTRKRLKARSCTWAEATVEDASQRPWAMRGR